MFNNEFVDKLQKLQNGEKISVTIKKNIRHDYLGYPTESFEIEYNDPQPKSQDKRHYTQPCKEGEALVDLTQRIVLLEKQYHDLSELYLKLSNYVYNQWTTPKINIPNYPYKPWSSVDLTPKISFGTIWHSPYDTNNKTQNEIQ